MKASFLCLFLVFMVFTLAQTNAGQDVEKNYDRVDESQGKNSQNQRTTAKAGIESKDPRVNRVQSKESRAQERAKRNEKAGSKEMPKGNNFNAKGTAGQSQNDKLKQGEPLGQKEQENQLGNSENLINEEIQINLKPLTLENQSESFKINQENKDLKLDEENVEGSAGSSENYEKKEGKIEGELKDEEKFRIKDQEEIFDSDEGKKNEKIENKLNEVQTIETVIENIESYMTENLEKGNLGKSDETIENFPKTVILEEKTPDYDEVGKVGSIEKESLNETEVQKGESSKIEVENEVINNVKIQENDNLSASSSSTSDHTTEETHEKSVSDYSTSPPVDSPNDSTQSSKFPTQDDSNLVLETVSDTQPLETITGEAHANQNPDEQKTENLQESSKNQENIQVDQKIDLFEAEKSQSENLNQVPQSEKSEIGEVKDENEGKTENESNIEENLEKTELIQEEEEDEDEDEIIESQEDQDIQDDEPDQTEEITEAIDNPITQNDLSEANNEENKESIDSTIKHQQIIEDFHESPKNDSPCFHEHHLDPNEEHHHFHQIENDPLDQNGNLPQDQIETPLEGHSSNPNSPIQESIPNHQKFKNEKTENIHWISSEYIKFHQRLESVFSNLNSQYLQNKFIKSIFIILVIVLVVWILKPGPDYVIFKVIEKNDESFFQTLQDSIQSEFNSTKKKLDEKVKNLKSRSEEDQALVRIFDSLKKIQQLETGFQVQVIESHSEIWKALDDRNTPSSPPREIKIPIPLD